MKIKIEKGNITKGLGNFKGMVKKTGRLFWPDFIRAVACICVVTVHFNANVSAWWTLDNGIALNYFMGMYLGTIGVNLFFIISGAMLMYTYLKRGAEPLREFYKRRFTTVYPMYWMAFFFATCVSFFVFGYMPSDNILWIINDITGFSGYLTMLGLTPIAFYQLGEWFLGAIICLYILAPILLFGIDKYGKQTLSICFIVYILLIKLEVNEKFVLMYVPHMLIGMVLIKLKEKFNFKESIISVALLLFLYLMQDILRLRNDIYSFLACICIYIILGFIGSNIEKINMLDKIVRWIAKYSYPIFLIHHRLITLLCLRFDLNILGKRDIYLLFLIFLILTALLSKGLYLTYKHIGLIWKTIKLGT